jgi:hypothetical protein
VLHYIYVFKLNSSTKLEEATTTHDHVDYEGGQPS